MNTVLPLAMGFVHPALLGGVALAAVPIIIHLLSRRQFRRVPWAATRFLLDAERRNRRRVRFEQWLLVALRCAAMALLALLVARPFVQPGLVAALLGGRGAVHRIIVLDDSASMAFRADAQPELARTRDAAIRLISWLSQEAPADPVTVLLTSQPGHALIERKPLGTLALDELQTRLARLAPAQAPANPAQSIQQVARLADEAESSGQFDVYVLSDFQRSDWFADRSAEGGAFASLVQRRRDDLRLILLFSGPEPRDNVALVSLRPDRPQSIAGFPAGMTAVIANFSSRALRDLSLQFSIDGAAIPPVRVDPIEPGQQRAVGFEVTFAEEGFRELTVSFAPLDGLALDDSRSAALSVRGGLSVLLVNGAPGSDPYEDEVYLLRTALAPPGTFGSGMRVDVIDAAELEGVSLGEYDCVVLCNVPPPTEPAVASLHRFVASGGGLAIFLGSEVGAPAEYNRALYSDGTGVLPLPLGELRDRVEPPQGVGIFRTADHAVTTMFPSVGASLSEYIHFRAYYRVGEPPAAAEAARVSDLAASGPAPARPAVLARYSDREQSPAIVECAVGRGRVLLFTSTVDADWNDWPRALDGSFVVTMLETVQYLARQSGADRPFDVGQTLTFSLDPERYEPEALFRSPRYPDEPAAEARVTPAPGAAGEVLIVAGPAAQVVGTYEAELRLRGGGNETRAIAVNPAPPESDLTRATAGELSAALSGVPHEIVPAAREFLQGDEESRRELWPTLLLMLVVLLLAEQTLAWWFGAAVSATHLAERGGWSVRRWRRGPRLTAKAPLAGQRSSRTQT